MVHTFEVLNVRCKDRIVINIVITLVIRKVTPSKFKVQKRYLEIYQIAWQQVKLQIRGI